MALATTQNRLLIDRHPDVFEEIEISLTNKYYPSIDIDKLTYASGKKVWWRCNAQGHLWETRVSHRSDGKGCPKCPKWTVTAGVNDFGTLFPELPRQWDKEKNADKNPLAIGFSDRVKIWWICDKESHGWQASVSNRTAGHGCPYCGGTKVLNGFNDLATIHPYLEKDWDEVKNKVSFGDSGVSKGSSKKVWWKCNQCQHSWVAMVSGRASGKGCPNCALGKTERGFAEAFSRLTGTDFSSSFIVGNRRLFKSGRIQVDAYSPCLNLVVEYDGEWTHGPKNPQGKSYEERLAEDADTSEALLNMGYKVIRIRENPLEYVTIDSAFIRSSKEEANFYQVSYKSRSSIDHLARKIIKEKADWFSL